MAQSRSVALHTLGCKLNYAETSAIERLMQNDGFVKKDFTEEADVYVINSGQTHLNQKEGSFKSRRDGMIIENEF